MMQEIQEENRKLQVSGYEWDITLTEQDVEEHGWIRGNSLLHAFETIASAHVDSLDMGFEQMIAQNRIWVMTKIKYVVYKRVDPGELYHLGTYPRPKKGSCFIGIIICGTRMEMWLRQRPASGVSSISKRGVLSARISRCRVNASITNLLMRGSKRSGGCRKRGLIRRCCIM